MKYFNLFFVIFWYQSQPVVTLESDILYFSPEIHFQKFHKKILEITSYFLEYTHKKLWHFYYCALRFDSLKLGFLTGGEPVNYSAMGL